MDRIISRFEVVIERALFLKGSLVRRAKFIAEPLIRTHVNVQLVVHVGVRSAYIDHAEVDKVGGILQYISTRAILANFLINHPISEGEGAQ
jgi:hypothetical protein